MDETYTVTGTLEVAGHMPGDTVTRAELDAYRLTDENVASLLSARMIELNPPPAKARPKAE